MSFKSSLFALLLLLVTSTSAFATSSTACDIQLWLSFSEEHKNGVEPEMISLLLNSLSPACQNNLEFSELSNERLFELFASHPEASISVLSGLAPEQIDFLLAQLAQPLHDGIRVAETLEAVKKIKQTELASTKQRVLDALTQSPTTFSLISIKNDWQTREAYQDWKPRQHYIIRTQNGIETKIELAKLPSDWEVINEAQVLILNGASEIQIIDFSQPKTIQNVDLDVGSVEILEIASFAGGFYFVSAEAEHLAHTTDALWRYEWQKGDYTSVAIPDSFNMSGLNCSPDGQVLAFEHTIASPEGKFEEIYQLIHFDLASQNARVLDQAYQSKAERFVKERAARAIHFQDTQTLIYLKSAGDKSKVYQFNLQTQLKRPISSLPYYVSSIAVGANESLSYRSKDNYIVSQAWTSGNFQKQLIPAASSLLSLQYY
ncbi:MAG: hypothetical protein AAFN10_28360 [Bacteroidota bacterium]